MYNEAVRNTRTYGLFVEGFIIEFAQLTKRVSFVFLLSHCRPRGGALENYFFQIQTYPRKNE